jgi:hypothetical protein
LKAAQAKNLVAQLMQWTDERATGEFAWLELMVDYKFDRYQQYGPGHRFYVHLLRWLSQFDASDRECAWLFLREQLVFVSQDEMHHLVSLTGPQIERAMRSAIAKRLGIPVYRVSEDEPQRLLGEMRCRTLYVGVSDGARIDVFRRYNEGLISNEQVVPMIEISPSKKTQLKEKLQKRLDGIKSSAPATFEWVCLIDDFTASGFTSIRSDKAMGVWDGKVQRFMEEGAASGGDSTLLSADAHILVHHYLASHAASRYVTDALTQFAPRHPQMRFIPSFTHVLPEDVVITAASQPLTAALLQKKYDPSIETNHTGPQIALGYREGGLPVVLDHNTPNNSVATLWAISDPSKPTYIKANHMCPLFPRRARHSDVRT